MAKLKDTIKNNFLKRVLSDLEDIIVEKVNEVVSAAIINLQQKLEDRIDERIAEVLLEGVIKKDET